MKKLILLLMTIVISSTALAQKKVGGAVLPANLNYSDVNLQINGAGVRERMWIDLYAAGLYLENRTTDASDVLNSKKPMAIRLHIVSKLITSDKMIEAVTEGFEKSTNGNTAPIQKEIDALLGFFKEEITKNDYFDLVYIPSRGIVAHKNGEERGVVKGEEVRKALFGIWLSSNPVNGGLKKDLLAGK